jgi:hypothetical protein
LEKLVGLTVSENIVVNGISINPKIGGSKAPHPECLRRTWLFDDRFSCRGRHLEHGRTAGADHSFRREITE